MEKKSIESKKIDKMRKEAGAIGFRPMPGRVIIRLFDSRAFKRTQLHLPDGVKTTASEVYREMPLQGIVVAVGGDHVNDFGTTRPMTLKVGDHVALDMSRRSYDFLFRGVKYSYAFESDVIGVYEDAALPNGIKWDD